MNCRECGPTEAHRNPCLSTQVRGDLVGALSRLYKKVDTFDGVIIETTGLADPGKDLKAITCLSDLANLTLILRYCDMDTRMTDRWTDTRITLTQLYRLGDFGTMS